jgi:hypothetical protein
MMNVIKVNTSTIGDNVVLPGIANRKIRVLAYLLTSVAQNYIVWKSGSTAISGNIYMSAYGNLAIHMGDLWPAGGLPVLETAIGEDLVISLNAATAIGGHLTYYYIGA